MPTLGVATRGGRWRRFGVVAGLIASTTCVAREATGTQYYADATLGDDSYDGLSPTWTGAANGPKGSIQAAIDISTNGDHIVVAPGRYTGDGNHDIEFGGRAITVSSQDPTNSAVVAATVVDIQGTSSQWRRGFDFQASETTNSRLLGFTIENGWHRNAAGIRCYESSPTIAHCVIANNYASNNGEGSGIECYNSSPVIHACTITNNLGRWGAGIYLNGSSARVTDCIITDNKAWNGSNGEDGGAIHCLGSSCRAVIERCVIARNYAKRWGGGVCSVASSQPTLRSCLVYGNSAPKGGGLYNGAGRMAAVNCTIYGNSATEYGGGMAAYNSPGDPSLLNCIVWTNTAPAGKGPQLALTWATLATLTTVDSCTVQGGQGRAYIQPGATLVWGTGNRTNPPALIDPGAGNYHLNVWSPCVDAGTTQAWMAAASDIDGQPRISGGTVDQGTDETVFRTDGIFATPGDGGTSIVTVTWSVPPGAACEPQSCSNLAVARWSPCGNVVTSRSTTLSTSFTITPPQQRTYYQLSFGM